MPTKLLTLRQAEERGYGKRDTLLHAIHAQRLKADKLGRDWVVTETDLHKAGYLARQTNNTNHLPVDQTPTKQNP